MRAPNLTRAFVSVAHSLGLVGNRLLTTAKATHGKMLDRVVAREYDVLDEHYELAETFERAHANAVRQAAGQRELIGALKKSHAAEKQRLGIAD